MEASVTTSIRIEIKAKPGEFLLKRPYPSHDSYSLASLWVDISMIYTPALDGGPDECRAFSHLHPQTGFKAYRERREGGWGPRTPAGWPKFMLRVEMLPDAVINALKLEWRERDEFGWTLPPWDVVDGKDVT